MHFTFADRQLDTATRELRVRSTGERIPLEPQVFDVLRTLVERADRVVPKEELLDTVWGTRFVSESALTSRVKDARKAVGDDGRAQRVIRTVHGTGYRLVAPVQVGEAAGVEAGVARGVGEELLERERELATLCAAADRAADEATGTIVLVAGEAGLGKTTLVRAFADRLRARSLRVLVGGCDDLVTPRTMGPVRDVAREIGGPLAAAFASDAAPEQIFTLLPELLGERPTALVVEDLHWADDATLDVVRFLARQVPDLPLVLVGTYRDEELGEGHRLRRVLGSLPPARVQRLVLEPLTVDAVATLALDSDLAATELHAITRGNPFFVTEVLASGRVGVSPTVRDAVLSRIDALGPTARTLLQHAAVVPSRVERWLLAELGEGAGEPAEAVAEAERAGVLGGDEHAVWFRHELARRAVEESLTSGARVAANRRVLEALARHGVEPIRLVHHARRSGDAAAVVRWTPPAVEEAIRLGSYSQAIDLLEHLLEHEASLDPRARATALSQLSYVLYMVNRITRSAVAGRRGVTAAETAGDPRILADALRRLSRTLYWSDGPGAAAAAIERALPLLEETGDEITVASAYVEMARAHSDLATVGPVAEPDPRVVEFAERALEVAERAGHPNLLCHALQYRGSGRLALGDPGGSDDLERAVDLAELDPRDELPARACVNAAGSSYRAGHLEAAERFARLGLERASGGEFSAGVYRLELTLHGVDVSRGRWAAAERGLRRLVDIPGEPGLMRPLASSLLVRLLARQGRHDEAATALRPALDVLVGSAEIAVVGPVTTAAVEAAWLAGTPEVAPELAAPALDLAARVGHRVTASEVARLLRLAGHAASPPTEPTGPWAPALAGRWRDAAGAWATLGCRYERAVELVASGEPAAADEGRRELADLGAVGALTALG